MAGKSPTQRTLELLRARGAYMVQVVERWNAYAEVRQDLFGFIDVLAVMPDKTGVVGIQATTASNLSSRVKKVMDDPALRWRATNFVGQGNTLAFWGWQQHPITKKWQVIERDFAKILLEPTSQQPIQEQPCLQI